MHVFKNKQTEIKVTEDSKAWTYADLAGFATARYMPPPLPGQGIDREFMRNSFKAIDALELIQDDPDAEIELEDSHWKTVVESVTKFAWPFKSRELPEFMDYITSVKPKE